MRIGRGRTRFIRPRRFLALSRPLAHGHVVTPGRLLRVGDDPGLMVLILGHTGSTARSEITVGE